MTMDRRPLLIGAIMLFVACMSFAGCTHVRGRPGPENTVVRPDEVLAFSTLYQENCSACHGENGNDGAAISLANPVFLAIAGEDNLREVVAKGVHGKLMPAFARTAGGTLTDQQVTALVQGIVHQWGGTDLLAGKNPPLYAAKAPGDAVRGQQAFTTFCARCHGATGEGGNMKDRNGNSKKVGSIVDPAYLALISDQGLRSITIAGRPDDEMPDWRSDAAEPLTDQQITDIVTWLASKRIANPGQPYLSPS